MEKYGFSLIEVLIALCLITTTSLVLLKQQWHIIQWANEQLLFLQANHNLTNACERLKANLPRQSLPPPFYWYGSKEIHIKWQVRQHSYSQKLICSLRFHQGSVKNSTAI